MPSRPPFARRLKRPLAMLASVERGERASELTLPGMGQDFKSAQKPATTATTMLIAPSVKRPNRASSPIPGGRLLASVPPLTAREIRAYPNGYSTPTTAKLAAVATGTSFRKNG